MIKEIRQEDYGGRFFFSSRSVAVRKLWPNSSYTRRVYASLSEKRSWCEFSGTCLINCCGGGKKKQRQEERWIWRWQFPRALPRLQGRVWGTRKKDKALLLGGVNLVFIFPSRGYGAEHT